MMENLQLDPPDILEPSELESHQTELASDLSSMIRNYDFNQAASKELYEAVENELDRLREVLK